MSYSVLIISVDADLLSRKKDLTYPYRYCAKRFEAFFMQLRKAGIKLYFKDRRRFVKLRGVPVSRTWRDMLRLQVKREAGVL